MLAAAFVVLKCYTIARGDLATALGILQYPGLATVVIAGLPSSLPLLTAAMLAYAVIQMIGSLGDRDRRVQWLPHEIVTFRPGALPHGGTQEVGCVLSEDSTWNTMLITGQGQEHVIIRVPDAAVTMQKVCERQPVPGNPASYVIDAHTLWRVATENISLLRTSTNTGCPYQGL